LDDEVLPFRPGDRRSASRRASRDDGAGGGVVSAELATVSGPVLAGTLTTGAGVVDDSL